MGRRGGGQERSGARRKGGVRWQGGEEGKEGLEMLWQKQWLPRGTNNGC